MANVLFGAGLFSHAFLYNFYLDGLGHPATVMGLAAAALTAGGLAVLFPAGLVVDRLGCGLAFLTAASVACTGLVAGAVVTTPLFIYAAAFLVGVGTAIWRVAMGPIIMQLSRSAMRTRAFSWNVSLLVGSGAIWTAVSGAVPHWIERTAGYSGVGAIRVALVLGAGGTLLSAVVFTAFRITPVGLTRTGPQPTSERSRADEGSRTWASELAVPAGLLLAVALTALWMTAGGLVIPFYNIYFLRTFDLPVERIGLLFAVVQGIAALGVFGSGELASRFGPRLVLALWVLTFAPALWALAVTELLPLAVFLYLLQSFVPPATNPLIDELLLERAPVGRRGAVSSWRNVATEVSGLTGSSLGGMVIDARSFGALFGLAGATAAVGGAGLVLALRRLAASVARSP